MNRPDPAPPDVADLFTRAAASLGRFAHRLVWFDTVSSTNDVAARYAEAGVPEGTVIAAHQQQAGRGRLGRAWASPAGAGLYVSVVLRPSAGFSPLLTLATGAAVVDGIAAATGLRATLKWPNDVYVGGRKLAGILAEASSGGAKAHVIVGIGINLLPAAYPPDVAARATSLEAELGRPVERGAVLVECLSALEARYDELESGHAAAIVSAWRERARPMLGRRVEWDEGDATRRGVAFDIDDGGALLVRIEAATERIVSGEVRWL